MYEIKFIPEAPRLELRLWGFWSDDVMRRFSDQLTRDVMAAKSKYTTFDVLSDSRELPLQSAGMVPKFRELIQSLDIGKYGKVAVLVQTILSKMQAERVEGGLATKVFLHRSEAIDWLAAGR